MEDIRDTVLNLIRQYGGFDGDHHKQWLIDQIARKCAMDKYEQWVVDYEDGIDGPKTYEWDCGVIP